jgi:hypothetical protein
MTHRRLVLCLCTTVLLSGCARPTGAPAPTGTPPAPTAAGTADPGVLASPLDPAALRKAVPALAEREARFTAALASNQPIVLFTGDLNEQARRAEDVAVTSARFQYFARDPDSGQALRSEIMTVRPALPADLAGPSATCPTDACYRVEMFNYSTNATAVAIVDFAKAAVLDVTYHEDTQPEIPAYLADIAAQIAIQSPEVADALGFKPGVGLAGMPSVKTALNGSQCERSHHLCVAPTFLRNEEGRALWAIVDLTDGRLVGVRWTQLGQGEAQPVTEQSLQDAVVMADYCETPHTLTRDGWELTYLLTSSDGLEVKDVKFEGRPVLRSAKLVDWHVSYSGEDGFGYSDASGCPLFSTASVVAFNGPVVEDIAAGETAAGFALWQDFRSELWPLPCNYRYMHRFEFLADGRFRVVAENLGRGCGNNGTYRPVVRIALAPGPEGDKSTLAQWDGSAWQPWTKEAWALLPADAPATGDGDAFRVLGGDGTGYTARIDYGPTGGVPRDHDAYLYLTRHKPEEGDTDMVTIGPCCNTDEHQGPEQFLDPPEDVQGQPLVLWFVPRLKNDDQPGRQYCWTETVIEGGVAHPQIHPCTAGLTFTPTR